MAKTASIMVSFTILAALLSLFLSVSTVESRLLEASEPVAPAPTVTCDKVYGVESGDTCFDIAGKFSLSTEDFGSINPNLVCDSLFVGQWICISGKPT